MKKVCVVTGTRAEYGLLKSLIKIIFKDYDLKLQLVVTGSHLSEAHGYTYKDIEADGFFINEMVDLNIQNDSDQGIAECMSDAITGITKAFTRLEPDIVILLGDRYEIFASACAATILRIPVAHISGGETTEGAFDEAFRHCITKMSHIHFTSTDKYRNRVIQLGESPDRVYNVGALGVEGIRLIELLDKNVLEEDINFKIDANTLLVTFHPVTLESGTAYGQFKELLDAIDSLKQIKVIFTKANADKDGSIINRMIDEYVNSNKFKATSFASMGQLRYLSAMKYVGAVVGNSSSGIVEAPSLATPTVNIGDRQRGRIQAESIINCQPIRNDICEAIKKALRDSSSEKFNDIVNPYDRENTSEEIITILKEKLTEDSFELKKVFYDIS